MNKAQRARFERLMPEGKPRYIRCYDSGPDEGADRYTVVYTGRYQHDGCGYFYVGMSGSPFHPQGVGYHGEHPYGSIDRPTYGHLGKKIKYDDLPDDCKKLVLSDYLDLWGLSEISIVDGNMSVRMKE